MKLSELCITALGTTLDSRDIRKLTLCAGYAEIETMDDVFIRVPIERVEIGRAIKITKR